MKKYTEYFVNQTDDGWVWHAHAYKDNKIVAQENGKAKTSDQAYDDGAKWCAKQGDK